MKLANIRVMIMTVARCLISSLSYPEEKAGRSEQEADLWTSLAATLSIISNTMERDDNLLNLCTIIIIIIILMEMCGGIISNRYHEKSIYAQRKVF